MKSNNEHDEIYLLPYGATSTDCENETVKIYRKTVSLLVYHRTQSNRKTWIIYVLLIIMGFMLNHIFELEGQLYPQPQTNIERSETEPLMESTKPRYSVPSDQEEEPPEVYEPIEEPEFCDTHICR